jgi:hypothetical protein
MSRMALELVVLSAILVPHARHSACVSCTTLEEKRPGDHRVLPPI